MKFVLDVSKIIVANLINIQTVRCHERKTHREDNTSQLATFKKVGPRARARPGLLPPDRSGGAPCRVAERRHTVAVGARRSSDTSGAIVEGGDAVAIGARAAGDASLGVVEANVLGLGGRERGKRGQECDGDDSHGRRFCDVLVMTPTLARSQRAGQAECPPTSPMFQFGSSLNDFLYRDWVGLARFAPSFASALAA